MTQEPVAIHRTKRPWSFAGLAVCCLAVLSGCSQINQLLGPPPVRDAQVESLSVDWRAPGWAGERVPPLLRDSFSTDVDLSTYPREHDSTIHVRVARCPGNPTHLGEWLSESGLLTQTGEPVSPLSPTTPDAAGRYAYRFYLDIPSRPRDLHRGEALIEHDYRRRSDDICFRFSGGSMLVGTHLSRYFRIPYALIADALARAGLPYAPVTPGS